MGAGFLNAVFGEHKDARGVSDGGQAVGNGEGGTPLGKGCKRALDKLFALVVKGACGLVKHKDGRAFEEHARNGNALFLAAGQPHAAFADLGVIALRELRNEVVGVGKLCRGDQFLFGGVRLAVKDVGADGAGKQIDILIHHADGAAKLSQRQICDAFAVQQDLPAVHIVKA